MENHSFRRRSFLRKMTGVECRRNPVVDGGSRRAAVYAATIPRLNSISRSARWSSAAMPPADV